MSIFDVTITARNLPRLIKMGMAEEIVKNIDALEAENARLKAEVERLTIQRAKLIESAEELFRFVGQELYGPIDHFEAAWEAAKEGKQP